MQIFMWKIFQDALPLGEALQRRGILSTNVKCARCGDTEMADHLFVHCRFTKRVWEFLPTTTPLTVLPTMNVEQALQLGNNLTNLPPTGVSLALFPWFAWSIWTSRNSLIFENLDLSPKAIANKAIRLAREWQSKHHTPQYQSHSTTRQVHPHRLAGTIDVYTDAAWRSIG